jgi:hypothetical protein
MPNLGSRNEGRWAQIGQGQSFIESQRSLKFPQLFVDGLPCSHEDDDQGYSKSQSSSFSPHEPQFSA